MKYRNFTPHAIDVWNDKGEIILTLPSEGVARIQVSHDLVEGDSIPLWKGKYSSIEGLPEHEEGTLIIVSSLVREHCTRIDLVSPSHLVRDGQGRVIGCMGFEY